MDFREFKRNQSRRSFLRESAGGIGMMAFWHLLSLDGLTAGTAEGLPEVNPLKPKPPHFTPRAKNVIYLFMAGAPSQLDLFDPKPEMKKWEGQSLPESMRKKFGNLAFIRPTAQVWASPRVFKPHGQSGIEFSDFLPHLATCADDICMIRAWTKTTLVYAGNDSRRAGRAFAGFVAEQRDRLKLTAGTRRRQTGC